MKTIICDIDGTLLDYQHDTIPHSGHTRDHIALPGVVKKMRQWVVNNIDTDASSIFRGIYDRMIDKVTQQSVPQLVLILADYQYKNAFVADMELNVVACMTEIMANVELI